MMSCLFLLGNFPQLPAKTVLPQNRPPATELCRPPHLNVPPATQFLTLSSLKRSLKHPSCQRPRFRAGVCGGGGGLFFSFVFFFFCSVFVFWFVFVKRFSFSCSSPPLLPLFLPFSFLTPPSFPPPPPSLSPLLPSVSMSPPLFLLTCWRGQRSAGSLPA